VKEGKTEETTPIEPPKQTLEEKIKVAEAQREQAIGQHNMLTGYLQALKELQEEEATP
jgi:hypothetical protein